MKSARDLQAYDVALRKKNEELETKTIASLAAAEQALRKQVSGSKQQILMDANSITGFLRRIKKNVDVLLRGFMSCFTKDSMRLGLY